MKKILLAAIGLIMVTQALTAETWLKSRAMTNNWQCIASSADGKKLVAGTLSGFIYVSRDSGLTWAQTSAPNDGWWNSAASSADGTRLLAVSADKGVFTSTNSGVTWASQNLPNANVFWGACASSADGKTLAATVLGESDFQNAAVFLSTNSGATWTSNHMSYVVGVAMSSDGTKIVAAASENVWRSTDSGTTWILLTNAPTLWGIFSPSQYIASSADGARLVMCSPGYPNYVPGFIYVSTNSGDSWNATSAPSNNWNSVASSADGKILIAIAIFNQLDRIYVSTNSGSIWSTNHSPLLGWNGVASSADGGNLFAVASTADNNSEFGTTTNGLIYAASSVQRPMVNIAPTNGQLMLSWFVPSSGFTLQHSPDFHNWVNVTNKPTPNNLEEQVILSGTNNIGFYRLKTP